MKKVLIIILSLILSLQLFSCSSKENENQTSSSVSTETESVSSSHKDQDPPEVNEIDKLFTSYVELCDSIGVFNSANDINSILFFFAIRNSVTPIKEEVYYHEYDTNKEFPHPIYTYDAQDFDNKSLKLFDTTFEYALLEDESFDFYDYTYNGMEQQIIEKVTGFGGGPEDITYTAIYDGYSINEQGLYIINVVYTAEDLMGNTWIHESVGSITVELVEDVYKIRSFSVCVDPTQQ